MAVSEQSFAGENVHTEFLQWSEYGVTKCCDMKKRIHDFDQNDNRLLS